MTIEYVDNSNGDGLFNILGKFVHLLDVLNTARGTTVATEALDAINQYKKKTNTTLSFDRAVATFAGSEQQWRLGGDTFAGAIRSTCQRLLSEFVQADDASIGTDLTAQLRYLIDEMTADGYYVGLNELDVSFAADAGNSNTEKQLIFPTLGSAGNGISESQLAEIITATVVATSPVTLQVTGERAARSVVAEDYPAGSGLSTRLLPLTVDDERNLLTNGGFEVTSSQVAALAASEMKSLFSPWIVITGTVGTDLVAGFYYRGTLAITGTPTAGIYRLTLSDEFADTTVTADLAFDATSTDIETELRKVRGWEGTVVSSTGTAPNVTHTIEAVGLTGTANITVSGSFDTGNIVATTAATGESTAWSGVDLTLPPTAVATKIRQPVTLDGGVWYCLTMRLLRSGSTTNAGTFRASIVDGGGNIVDDADGNSVTLTQSVGGVGTVFTSAATSLSLFFRLPAAGGGLYYVQLELEDNASSAATLYLDDVILAPAVELYPGAPLLLPTVTKRTPAIGDKYTLEIANSLANEWQLAFDRLFDARTRRLALPISGATEISTSLIG